MKLIQYIGSRESKSDNVSGTGLVWTRGQIHSVSDDQAKKFLNYPSVWQEVFDRPEVVVSPPVKQRPLRSVTGVQNG